MSDPAIGGERCAGEGKNTNPMVRLSVGSQVQQTSIQWDTLEPTWDESLTFYRVRACSMLALSGPHSKALAAVVRCTAHSEFVQDDILRAAGGR